MDFEGYEFVPLVDDADVRGARETNWCAHVNRRVLTVVSRHSPEGPTRDKEIRCNSRIFDDRGAVECTVTGDSVRLDSPMLAAILREFPGARFSHDAARALVFRVPPRKRHAWIAYVLFANAALLVALVAFKK